MWRVVRPTTPVWIIKHLSACFVCLIHWKTFIICTQVCVCADSTQILWFCLLKLKILLFHDKCRLYVQYVNNKFVVWIWRFLEKTNHFNHCSDIHVRLYMYIVWSYRRYDPTPCSFHATRMYPSLVQRSCIAFKRQACCITDDDKSYS